MKSLQLLNITVTYSRIFLIRFIWLLIASGFLFNCSKSSNNSEPNPGPTSDTIFNRVITVLNYGSELDGNAPTTGLKPVYFSLEKNAPLIRTTLKQTDGIWVSARSTGVSSEAITAITKRISDQAAPVAR